MTLILILFATATLAFLWWRFWFFLRNPARQHPPGNGFLSPADGYVVYIKRVELGLTPIAVKQQKVIPLAELTAYPPLQGCSGFLIGVYMTAFSVHHNRAPLGGRVAELIRVHATKNHSMARMMTHLLVGCRPFEDDCTYLVENDRVTTVIKTNQGYYSLTQIADKWISHIINDCVPGQPLQRGERFGLIRFGSQVDVFLPDELGYRPVVRLGDYVYAGETILAEYDK